MGEVVEQVYREWDEEIVEYDMSYRRELQAIGLTELPRAYFGISRAVITLIYKITEGNVYFENKRFIYAYYGYREVSERVNDVIKSILVDKVVQDPPKSKSDRKAYIVKLSDVEKHVEEISKLYMDAKLKERYNTVIAVIEKALHEKVERFKTSDAKEETERRVKERVWQLVQRHEDSNVVVSEIMKELDTIVEEARRHDMAKYIEELEKRLRETDEQVKRLEERIRELESGKEEKGEE